ncbi:MAG: hypothetical protein K2M76_06780, partial [Muribaculaceae bacterium]|nr:hypothetical protein [Muribaculaceae bacterium]
MKKVLLTSCAVIAAMTASAEVYTFIADGCAPHRALQANQSHVTMIPLGYYGISPTEAGSTPSAETQKALVCDGIMIEDMAEGNGLYTGSWRMMKDVPVKITPAAGLTITNIRMKASVPNYLQTIAIINPTEGGYDIVQEFNKNTTDTIATLEGSYSEAFQIACTTE